MLVCTEDSARVVAYTWALSGLVVVRLNSGTWEWEIRVFVKGMLTAGEGG